MERIPFLITGLIEAGIKEMTYLLWYVFGRTDNKLISELLYFSLGNIIKPLFCVAAWVRISNLLQLSEVCWQWLAGWLFGDMDFSVSSTCKSCDSVTLTSYLQKRGWVGVVIDMFKSVFCALCLSVGWPVAPEYHPLFTWYCMPLVRMESGRIPGWRPISSLMY